MPCSLLKFYMSKGTYPWDNSFWQALLYIRGKQFKRLSNLPKKVAEPKIQNPST